MFVSSTSRSSEIRSGSDAQNRSSSSLATPNGNEKSSDKEISPFLHPGDFTEMVSLPSHEKNTSSSRSPNGRTFYRSTTTPDSSTISSISSYESKRKSTITDSSGELSVSGGVDDPPPMWCEDKRSSNTRDKEVTSRHRQVTPNISSISSNSSSLTKSSSTPNVDVVDSSGELLASGELLVNGGVDDPPPMWCKNKRSSNTDKEVTSRPRQVTPNISSISNNSSSLTKSSSTPNVDVVDSNDESSVSAVVDNPPPIWYETVRGNNNVRDKEVTPRHRQVTPNISSISGNPSSLTKSSSTSQASTSFKVVAVVEGLGVARGEIGMAYIDMRTPLLVLSQFADTQAYIRLAVQLNLLQPIEVIMPHTVMQSRSKIVTRIREMFPEIIVVTVMRKHFNETKGLHVIQDLCVPEYRTVEVEVASKYYCLSACAALIKYMEFKQSVTYASHSLKIVYRTSADTTMITSSAARDLELVTNELGNIEHTLYGILNHTLTPGGDRLLRANILQPPCDINTINTRLDCIAELMDNEDLFNDLKSVIEKFMGTEHMLSLCIQIPKEKSVRYSEHKITNVISLKHALDLVKPLHNYLSKAKNALFQTYYQALSDERFQELQTKIGVVIHSDTRWQKGILNMHMQKCFAVKSNINGLLDIARRVYSESVNDVSDIVKQLENQYDLPMSLGYNSLKGFFIQIQKKAIPQIDKLPSSFIKVNKFKNLIICTTEDLIKLNDRIRESLNEIYLMSDIIIDEVLAEVRGNIVCLYNLAEIISTVDFLLSLTHACTLNDHVRPEFSNVFVVKDGRHPVIEKIIGTTYIPNDTFMSEELNFTVLSGANMSGKTTYLKQVAVLQIMAQMGCYVPAAYGSFRIAENILVHMRCSSDIEKNYSSFLLQMKQVHFILQHATENSLIIMDEIGTGTNVEEGSSLAYAIGEELLKKKAFTIFATHFTEIIELASAYPNVENYHMRVDYDLNGNGGCVCNFSHIITPGPCKEKQYGIKIAELSAIPSKVLQDATKMAQSWEESRQNDTVTDTINEEKKEKIKMAILFILMTEHHALEDDELKRYLQDMKAQFTK